ncbi:activator of 90 kDa heat shock protein ATPase homolog 2 isoform X3 [Globicephala melas]|uniref:activator of 90 kDa heat shock protein ATPase homolog 2 isoform X3 n=1 Tax=Globicephala melas TaxID=9731 RepID=UPI00293D89E5|nr:activator of 90 kDa heat shock protein ATPase homolog 2 isoform X4 [Globicephala melas]
MRTQILWRNQGSMRNRCTDSGETLPSMRRRVWRLSQWSETPCGFPSPPLPWPDSRLVAERLVVNVSKKKGDGNILKDLMKTAGTAKVREALGDYLKALKTEFTMGMILPTKAMATQELTVKRKLSETTLQIQASSPVELGVRIPTVALHMTELFDTAIEQLYRIFTVKDLVQKFSKSPAVLEAEKGRKFQMFDGNITGEYVELLTNKKIVMKWRCRNWPEEHYAIVALNFVPTLGQTELQLDCKGVPVCEEENMKFCWQKQHFEEIQGLLQLITLNG